MASATLNLRVQPFRLLTRAEPGTLGKLIALYRGHAVFLDLADLTRADYQKVFDYLQPIADTALPTFNRALVVRIHDRAAERPSGRGGASRTT